VIPVMEIVPPDPNLRHPSLPQQHAFSRVAIAVEYAYATAIMKIATKKVFQNVSIAVHLLWTVS